MLKNFAIAAIAVVTIMSATPSFSQSIEIGPGGVRVNPGMEPPPPRDMGISERQAIRIARRSGVQDVDDVARRRNVIVVRGVDRDGDDIKVVIDRYTGDVLSVD
ncbi:MAG: PepSY domain-containing protein [Rhizobium sp.]